MLPLTLALALAADPAAAPAGAADPFREADESELFRFEEQLVTVASRYAQTIRKAPSIVSLITAEEIRQRGYRTLSDILRDLPGIYIWRGPEGRDLAAFRGVISADNNKLLILVDGQPWYDGVYTSGFVDEYFPIGHIRQVEVIKGPGSAIYGTNAFSGVVNIVTFGASDLQGARVRWQAGSHGRTDIVASAGGTARTGSIETSISAYARMLGSLGEGLTVTPEGKVDVPNTDPKRSVNVGAKLNIADLQLQLHHVDYQHTYLFNERENPYEVLARSLGDFDLTYRNTYFDARYVAEVSRDLKLTPYLSSQYHDNASAYFYGGDITVDPTTLEASQFLVTVDAEKRTRRFGTGLDVEARPGIDHVVVGGLGVEDTAVLRFFDRATPLDGEPYIENGFAIYDECGQIAGLYDNAEKCPPPRLRNLFAFAQYTWTAAPSVELTAGARVDKRIPTGEGQDPTDGVFVTSVSPRLGLLLVPTDRTTAKLLYGRAIRLPNVREALVFADPDATTGVYPFSSGNINLVPENINTVEGELVSQVADGLELRADSSFSQVNQEIDKIDPGVYCNLPAALRVVGAELGFDANAGPLRVASTYALTMASYSDDSELDPDICDFVWTESYAGRTQYEFPPHMVKSRVGLAVTDQLQLWLLNEVYGPRPRQEWSPDAGIPDGEAFTLLHLGVSFDDIGKNENFRVGASVRNLLDQRWNFGVYRDDSNEADITGPALGESRAVLMDVEATF